MRLIARRRSSQLARHVGGGQVALLSAWGAAHWLGIEELGPRGLKWGARKMRSQLLFGAIVCAAMSSAISQELGAGSSESVAATGIAPYQEYRKHLESAREIAPLDLGLFGEKINLYNGSTTFEVSDIALPGNGSLPVNLTRRVSIEVQPQGEWAYDTLLAGAGNWDIDVPYVAATYPQSSGWHSQRCSMGSVPPISNAGFHRSEVWQGIAISIPGRGSTNALGLGAQVPRPSDGRQYVLSTTERDVLECIPMKSGLPGEGFRMTTSSGTRYYFDVGVTRTAATLERWENRLNDVPLQRLLRRNKFYLLASRLEDRFGNSVEFQYNAAGHPTRIWSSDGREIVLTYSNGRLTTATANGRTWQYQYHSIGGGRYGLAAAVQPDGSKWQYTYSGNLFPPAPSIDTLPPLPYCSQNPLLLDVGYQLSATHPSGASGTFTFSNRRHYRSGVHASECLAEGADPETRTYKLLTPHFFDVMSLDSKSIAGPGLHEALTWAYDYGANFETLWGSPSGPASYPCTTCTPYKVTTLTRPDASKERYRFGIVYWLNDSRELLVDTLNASGTTARSVATDYLAEVDVSKQNFHGVYGTVLGGVGDPALARVRPVVKRSIVQEGTTFLWQVPEGCGGVGVHCFDAFGRPTQEQRSSAATP